MKKTTFKLEVEAVRVGVYETQSSSILESATKEFVARVQDGLRRLNQDASEENFRLTKVELVANTTEEQVVEVGNKTTDFLQKEPTETVPVYFTASDLAAAKERVSQIFIQGQDPGQYASTESDEQLGKPFFAQGPYSRLNTKGPKLRH